LSALFDWQTAAPYRQVALLSGDVHAASAFTIHRRGKFGAILECTSSPLTTKATRLERWLNLIATRAPNLLEPELHFERHFLVLANNHGLVRLRPLPGGGHHIELTVRAWEERSRAFRAAGRLASAPEFSPHAPLLRSAGERGMLSGFPCQRAFDLRVATSLRLSGRASLPALLSARLKPASPTKSGWKSALRG